MGKSNSVSNINCKFLDVCDLVKLFNDLEICRAGEKDKIFTDFDIDNSLIHIIPGKGEASSSRREGRKGREDGRGIAIFSSVITKRGD